MKPISRRSFIKNAATGAGAAAAVLVGTSKTTWAGANDRVRVAVIGINGRGRSHLGAYTEMDNVDVVTLCDVDSRLFNARAKEFFTRAGKPEPKMEQDIRKVLEDKDVDAISIATPNHWHSLATVWACQAGKDVYVEKPLGHNIAEGRAIVAAAEAGKRIVQIGLQQRSGPHFIEAVRRIRAGELGKVSCVHAWNAWSTTGMGGDLGNPPDEARAPEGIDYDRWLGPAPLRPFNPRRLHFSFYFWWDYAGGMVSDWGVHLFDIVLWALGSDILSVAATGGRHVFKDCRETPDTVDAVFECPDYIMAYSMRHGSGFPYHGAMDHGIMFFGTKAMLRIDRASFEIFPEGAREPALTVKDQGQDQHHKLDFLAAVRSRKKPAADALCGHLAAIPGHLANISLRVGRKLVWDPKTETIAGDREASALLAREYRAPYTL